MSTPQDDRPSITKATEKVAYLLAQAANHEADLADADRQVEEANLNRSRAIDAARRSVAALGEATTELNAVLASAYATLPPYFTEPTPEGGEGDVEADYTAQGDGADAAAFVQVDGRRDSETHDQYRRRIADARSNDRRGVQ